MSPAQRAMPAGQMEAASASAPHQPRAVVISLSSIANDLRVRRQIAALLADGWAVTSIGYGERNGQGPSDHHIVVPDLGFDVQPLARALRVMGLIAVRGWSGLGRHIWRAQSRHRALMQAVATLREADLVIANDYTALPAGLDLAKSTGAGLLYDTHEYAAGERAEDMRWRLLYPPYVRALERDAIAAGAAVSTVSEGIAARIADEYAIVPPFVVRNLPSYRAMPSRTTDASNLVHYHGVVVPGRGLEALIDSVALWEPRFRLRIRGPATQDYRQALEQRALRRGVSERIAIESAVPADQLVEQAADADIGIHVLPGFSHQNSHALPNKLFEYLMAGLAVVVTDLPEMQRIVRQEGVGNLVSSDTPEAIAAAVNAMTVQDIARCRAAALVSARRLCWEQEAPLLLKASRHAIALKRDTAEGAC